MEQIKQNNVTGIMIKEGEIKSSTIWEVRLYETGRMRDLYETEEDERFI